MKKKIFIFISLFLLIIFNFGSLSFASTKVDKVDVFTDSTSIGDDFVNLNLNIDDYFKSSDNSYNKYFVIGVSENYTDDFITSYFYLYNPNGLSNIGYNFGCTLGSQLITLIGDSSEFDDLTFIKCEYVSSYDNFIIKYKFQYFNSNYSSRFYSFTDILPSGCSHQSLNYSCTFTDDIDNLNSSFESVSTFFISDDKIVTVYLNNVSLDSSWNNFWSALGFSNQPQLFFYNFNSNQEFDSIIDISFEYTMNHISSYHNTGIINGSLVDSVNYKTENCSRTLYPGTYNYSWSNIDYSFEYFKVPGNERFSDNEFQNLSEYLTRSDFNYQASVLFDVRDVPSCCVSSNFSDYVENVSMTEITVSDKGVVKKFTKTDIVDSDGPDVSEDPVITPGDDIIIPIPSFPSFPDLSGILKALFILIGIICLGGVVFVFVKFFSWLINLVKRK